MSCDEVDKNLSIQKGIKKENRGLGKMTGKKSLNLEKKRRGKSGEMKGNRCLLRGTNRELQVGRCKVLSYMIGQGKPSPTKTGRENL